MKFTTLSENAFFFLEIEYQQIAVLVPPPKTAHNCLVRNIRNLITHSRTQLIYVYDTK